MNESNKKVIIIGGGLSGLTLAFLLRQQNINVMVLEARDRLGGRIFTAKSNGQAPLELGATWFNRTHTAVLSLLSLLQIDTFQQRMDSHVYYEPFADQPHQLVQIPPNNDPSFRVIGGTSKLIDGLAQTLNQNDIYLNTVVTDIKESNNLIEIKTNHGSFNSDILISTLPPYLLQKSINFDPELPKDLTEVADQTHTWMSESIKVGLRYKEPFWRKEGSCGTVYSNAGPITEFYDHSNYEDKLYALKGFVKDEFSKLSKDERIKLIMKQLSSYYGEQAASYISYEETVWRSENYTHQDYSRYIIPHQNNGHPIYSETYYKGKLFISGSETASHFGGYMEGAIRSALRTSEQIKNLIKHQEDLV